MHLGIQENHSSCRKQINIIQYEFVNSTWSNRE